MIIEDKNLEYDFMLVKVVNMQIDKETELFLKNRVKKKAKLHHLLEPNELRQDRLRQLKEDNLIPPKILSVKDIKVKGKYNQDINLRFYFSNKYKQNKKNPVILFFHGGGFVMGNLDTHDFTCRSICIESNMIIIAVDYSLSPEYKFPYALNEAKHILKSIPSFEKEFKLDLKNIFVCGDSAGGNLAAVLAINSSKKTTIPIKGQILIYPCVDLTLSMKSMDIYLDGMTLTFDTMSYFINHYLESKEDSVNWQASPLFVNDMKNMPETYIFAAGLDPLLDEGLAYKNRLEYFGNKVTYKLYPGQIHGFLSNSKHFPKSAECIIEIGKAAQLMST